jgi:transposase-like protein
MKRPDLDTLACVNPECQQFRLRGQGNLTGRKVYGQDWLRLLRCRTCGEEFSERRGPAGFNTKIAEAQAADVITHLGEGCGVRATARLVHVSKDTVARLLRMAGRHAERFHDQRVRDVTPRALEFDEQWSFVKKSRSVVRPRSAPRLGTCGPILPSQRIAS